MTEAMTATLLGASLLLAAAGPVLLRVGWQRRRDAVVAGWVALIVAATIALGGFGAWGLATAAVTASLVAMALLAHAAGVTPAPARPVRNPNKRRPTSAPSPQAGAARIATRDLARRIGVFLIAVPLDIAAALAFAWACQRWLYLAGWQPANSTLFALMVLPLAWLALLSWQMTRSRPLTMLPAALFTALPGGLTWLTL